MVSITSRKSISFVRVVHLVNEHGEEGKYSANSYDNINSIKKNYACHTGYLLKTNEYWKIIRLIQLMSVLLKQQEIA